MQLDLFHTPPPPQAHATARLRYSMLDRSGSWHDCDTVGRG